MVLGGSGSADQRLGATHLKVMTGTGGTANRADAPTHPTPANPTPGNPDLSELQQRVALMISWREAVASAVNG